MKVSVKNAIVLTIECATTEMAKEVVGKFHEKLTGLEDYVESEVLLNIDDKTITLAVGEHSTKFTFMAVLGELVGLAAFNHNRHNINPPEDSVVGYKPAKLKMLNQFK